MHASEDELVLYFYGDSREPGEIQRHLEECVACAAQYREIAGTLTLVGQPDTPSRDERYGADVWQRIRRELPDQERRGWLAWCRWNRAALAAAVATLVVCAFAVGRLWLRPHETSQRTAAIRAEPDASERVRLAAIADHLEQSERVLLDVVNARGTPADMREEQASASTLVDSNRLFRDAAARAGDLEVADLLDDLERGLLDIVHGPARLAPAQLDEALVRLDAEALLFKVRVLAQELHERERAPVTPRKTI